MSIDNDTVVARLYGFNGKGGDRDLDWGEEILETSSNKVIDAIAKKEYFF